MCPFIFYVKNVLSYPKAEGLSLNFRKTYYKIMICRLCTRI